MVSNKQCIFNNKKKKEQKKSCNNKPTPMCEAWKLRVRSKRRRRRGRSAAAASGAAAGKICHSESHHHGVQHVRYVELDELQAGASFSELDCWLAAPACCSRFADTSHIVWQYKR